MWWVYLDTWVVCYTISHERVGKGSPDLMVWTGEASPSELFKQSEPI